MAQEIIEVPMTGKIITVDVKVGTKLNEGDTICVLESMKLENPIVAAVGGQIHELVVTPNQVVKPGQKIAVIEY